MKRNICWCLFVVFATTSYAKTASIELTIYKGEFASVNSYIFSNGSSLVLLDTQRTRLEAEKLAELIHRQNLPLTHILISHGHTDHFTGMAVLHREFPNARIVVASAEIKRDIEEYALYMDSGGATGGEPALDPDLKPRSAENPHGFNYEGLIEVLPTNELKMSGGGALELTTRYPPTEAKHMTTVYCRPIRGLFLADLAYNRVHLWMGDDITLERIGSWRAELVRLQHRYGKQRVTIYPGHGDPGGLQMLGDVAHYIDDFTQVVRTAGSREQAQAEMIRRYPDYREAGFFLKYSIANHVP
jgi:glyoxylase-like metal-dependent hydrolase (beta-lactamase superfamily II)